jgi:hypothetical protein
VQQAHLFVAVLGASSYTYAEATGDEQLANWIGAHVRAFEFYEGTPKLVVPDNTKTGVTKACRYERLPDLKASLAVYRLVFGQPRQEDLLSHLKERDREALAAWRFDLSPPVTAAETLNGRAIQRPDTPEPDQLVCRRCGDEVGHLCNAERNGKGQELHWRPGDEVMLFYRGQKSGGLEFWSAEVLHVNDDWAEVNVDNAVRELRFRGGNVLWDPVLKEHCQLASHFDPSGSEEIALVCPQCGTHRLHRCGTAGPALLPFGAGARINVTYRKYPGLDEGTFPGFVVRTSGRVARVHFTYQDGETEITHLYQSPDGTWRDLDYGVPCEIVNER